MTIDKESRRTAHVATAIAYLAVWALLLALFWLTGAADDAMGFALLAFYVVLPAATIVTSALVGADASWGPTRWLVIPALGVMFMLATFLTFDLANSLEFGKANLPDPGALVPGVVSSAVGYGLGLLAASRRRGA